MITLLRNTHPFVADFMGETNLLSATVSGTHGGMLRCRLDGGAEFLAEPAGDAAAGRQVTLSLRPERIVLSSDSDSGLAGEVTGCAYRGTDTTYRIKLETGLDMVVREQNIAGRRDKFSVGDGVALLIAPGAARILAD